MRRATFRFRFHNLGRFEMHSMAGRNKTSPQFEHRGEYRISNGPVVVLLEAIRSASDLPEVDCRASMERLFYSRSREIQDPVCVLEH